MHIKITITTDYIAHEIFFISRIQYSDGEKCTSIFGSWLGYTVSAQIKGRRSIYFWGLFSGVIFEFSKFLPQKVPKSGLLEQKSGVLLEFCQSGGLIKSGLLFVLNYVVQDHISSVQDSRFSDLPEVDNRGTSHMKWIVQVLEVHT